MEFKKKIFRGPDDGRIYLKSCNVSVEEIVRLRRLNFSKKSIRKMIPNLKPADFKVAQHFASNVFTYTEEFRRKNQTLRQTSKELSKGYHLNALFDELMPGTESLALTRQYGRVSHITWQKRQQETDLSIINSLSMKPGDKVRNVDCTEDSDHVDIMKLKALDYMMKTRSYKKTSSLLSQDPLVVIFSTSTKSDKKKNSSKQTQKIAFKYFADKQIDPATPVPAAIKKTRKPIEAQKKKRTTPKNKQKRRNRKLTFLFEQHAASILRSASDPKRNYTYIKLEGKRPKKCGRISDVLLGFMNTRAIPANGKRPNLATMDFETDINWIALNALRVKHGMGIRTPLDYAQPKRQMSASTNQMLEVA